MGLETTVSDYRSTVKSFRNGLGLGEGFVGISASLCRCFLIGGMAAARRLVIGALRIAARTASDTPSPFMSFKKSSSTLKVTPCS